LARADDRDEWDAERGGVAAHGEDRCRIGELGETRGVRGAAERDEAHAFARERGALVREGGRRQHRGGARGAERREPRLGPAPPRAPPWRAPVRTPRGVATRATHAAPRPTRVRRRADR
jgi:hypothetical protein